MFRKLFVVTILALTFFSVGTPRLANAEDFTSPHIFEPGEVLSADVLNEILNEIKETLREPVSTDLVGTWSCTQTTGKYLPESLDSDGAVGATADADGITQQRTDTVTFTDDGDGTFSWSATTYNFFWPYASTNHTATSGVYTVSNGIFVSKTIDDYSYTPMLMKKYSPTRIKIFRVAAVNRLINSIVCDKQNTPPVDKPTSLSATSSGLVITLSWTDNSDDETGFKVMRRDSLEGAWTTIDTTSAGATSYTDTVSTAGTYWYRVQATNENGDSLGTNISRIDIQ